MCKGSNNSRKQAHFKPLHCFYPVSCPENPFTMRCCLMAKFFFLLLVSILITGWGKKSFMTRITTRGMFHFFSNCFHFSRHYLTDSELFCKVALRQLRPGPALSLSCISWSSPSDGSPLMPFSDVSYWWQGKVASVDLWCLSLPACAAPVQTTEDSQRTS